MASASHSDSSLHLGGIERSTTLSSNGQQADEQVRASMLSLIVRKSSGNAGQLSAVLHRLFHVGQDRIFGDVPWSVAQSNTSNLGLRVDDPHLSLHDPSARPNSNDTAQLFAALGAANAQVHLNCRHWVIAVVRESSTLSQQVIGEIRHLKEAGAQLLLIIYDQHPTETKRASRRWADTTSLRMMRIAEQSNIQYVGPVAENDGDSLEAAITTIKSQGEAVLLHLRVDCPRAPDELPLLLTHSAAVTAPEPGASMLSLAAEELVHCAHRDSRVVAMNMMDSSLVRWTWRDLSTRFFEVNSSPKHALSWCFGASSVGCRPFVFLTADDLQDHLGYIHRELRTKRHPITLLASSERNTNDGITSTSTLGLHSFQGMPVVLPRNATDLRQMLRWSIQHDGPLVIWLDESIRFAPESLEVADVEFGCAETLIQGQDLALLCWGAAVTPTWEAAQKLAENGVAATVVNLRFASPLDVCGIAKAVAEVASIAIIDDPSVPGLAGSLLEMMAQHDVGKPISLISLGGPLPQESPQERYDRTVCQVLDGCRWLGEPVSHGAAAPSNVPDMPATTANHGRGAVEFFNNSSCARQDQHSIRTLILRPDVERWLHTYLKAGKRGLYFWKWCAFGCQLTTLPGVAAELRKHVYDTKTLSIMLCVLLDDVADQRSKTRLLNAVINVVNGKPPAHCDERPEDEQRYLHETSILAAEYYQRVSSYPRYNEFEELLHFDQMQYFNTMHYSQLLNRHLNLLNTTEHDLYMPHAMHMMSFATLDLMCMPDFCASELGRVREAVWHAQCMGRVGNLLSTWRREIGEEDFNSGVFARAIEYGDLRLNQLSACNAEQIETAIVDGGHEDFFLDRWHFHRDRLRSKVTETRSIDLRPFLTNHERFFQMHLGSRGLI